jgi:hypothetical protein
MQPLCKKVKSVWSGLHCLVECHLGLSRCAGDFARRSPGGYNADAVIENHKACGDGFREHATDDGFQGYLHDSKSRGRRVARLAPSAAGGQAGKT